jgi:hypothetical protein
MKESWAKGLIYCDMEGFAVLSAGSLILLDECGSHVYPPEGRFRVEWLRPPGVDLPGAVWRFSSSASRDGQLQNGLASQAHLGPHLFSG